MNHELRELKDDARDFYLWAERVCPSDDYGVSYHLFEVERAISNLNAYIKANINNNG